MYNIVIIVHTIHIMHSVQIMAFITIVLQQKQNEQIIYLNILFLFILLFCVF